jgi:hypothetical protein
MSKRRRSPSVILTGLYAGLFALALNMTFMGAFYGWHLPPRVAGEGTLGMAMIEPAPAQLLRPGLDLALARTTGDLPVTVVEKQVPEAVALSDHDQDVDLAQVESPPVASASASAEEDAAAEVDSTAPADALPEGVPAMLRASDRGVEIGNFKSVTMQGSADECLAIGQSLTNSVKGSQLDVMVTSSQITIAKICASNGAVFLTCRAGQISISPRRARPDSRCDKDDV